MCKEESISQEENYQQDISEKKIIYIIFKNNNVGGYFK